MMFRPCWLVLSCLALSATSATAAAGSLNRAIVVAADGTFLGTCEGTVNSRSISNDFGNYGGQYGMNSMFNQYGRYGGQYSSGSPFNQYSTQVPYLLAYSADLYALFTSSTYRPSPAIISAIHNSGASRITVSQYMARAIDPNVLRVACRNP